jgi:dipeptidyl aminopeptidase/acylaminoacyl peptidase
VQKLVELAQVTDLAVRKDGSAAFVIKKPSLSLGRNSYILYEVSAHGATPRRLLEAVWMGQLSARPGALEWTILADLGQGVQLYTILLTGSVEALVTNPALSLEGAKQSVISASATEGPRRVGVVSYEWAPDGRALWYSAYRRHSQSERQSLWARGIVFDDRNMDANSLRNDLTEIAGSELYAFDPETRTARLLKFIPAGLIAGVLFDRSRSAAWQEDSRHIQYEVPVISDDGSLFTRTFLIDAQTGLDSKATPVPVRAGPELKIQPKNGSRHLVSLAADEAPIDLGETDALAIRPLAANFAHGTKFYIVTYRNRDGLLLDHRGRLVWIGGEQESIRLCDGPETTGTLTCVREGPTIPPRIVTFREDTGAQTRTIRVDPQAETILPLHAEYHQWANRFGNVSDGYLVLPRTDRAQKLPMVVVTHGAGARNEFANDTFQWEFPVQVLAERGYAVLLVNEPETPEAIFGARSGETVVPTRKMQFAQIDNPLATLDAAVAWAVGKGIADPRRVAIVGYSRGAELVEYALSQTDLFATGIAGDAGGFNPGGYWAQGWAPFRVMFRQLYGGSPYDPAAANAYQRYSPAHRARLFSGPYLQLFSQASAPLALELHSLLRDAAIPTELIVFPEESHVFWNPLHRAAAMNHSIDWLDYWLLGVKSKNITDADTYARWDRMKVAWSRPPRPSESSLEGARPSNHETESRRR